MAGGEGHAGAVTCSLCQRTIHSEYYDVSGHAACADCRGSAEALTQTPRGAGPLLKAGVFGLGAGIVGAIIYYAVIAITDFEIGIVAILIGYMVGYGVRKGAGGRGGRRFQVLAIALTYAAVALAYTPIVIQAELKHHAARREQAKAEERPEKTRSLPAAIAIVAGLVAALPILVIAGGLPSSLISAAIIFFGMQQAWKMTRVTALEITGPYRVGAPPSTAASV
jgi:hypothetical protein